MALIHKFMQGGEYYVVDVNSGSVHIVDDLIYNMIDNDNKLSSKESLIEKLKDKYPVEEIEEAYEDLLQLVEEDALYSGDLYEEVAKESDKAPSYIKSSMLKCCT